VVCSGCAALEVQEEELERKNLLQIKWLNSDINSGAQLTPITSDDYWALVWRANTTHKIATQNVTNRIARIDLILSIPEFRFT
jgi:hypothetical protein